MDRCRVWESHADPEIRRVSKLGPEPVYPVYVVRCFRRGPTGSGAPPSIENGYGACIVSALWFAGPTGGLQTTD